MSKMFESLRRAEAARKKRTAPPAVVPDKPTIEPVPRPEPRISPLRPEPGLVAVDGMPVDFLRELGILKNSIETALGRLEKRSILFAGSAEREGTTTIVVSFAKLLSIQTREKVLLIEMNARRPALASRMGLQTRAGVTEFFAGAATFDEIVERSREGTFDVIHVGEHEPAKIQLHLDRMFPKLLEVARLRYDTVLVDAPPVVVSPETPPLSSFVDGVVIVIQCGRTKREVIKRSLNMIEQFKGKVVGLILNRKKYFIPDFIYRRI